MERQAVVICIYAREGDDAGAIIESSFRLFLRKELQELEFKSKNNPCFSV